MLSHKREEREKSLMEKGDLMRAGKFLIGLAGSLFGSVGFFFLLFSMGLGFRGN